MVTSVDAGALASPGPFQLLETLIEGAANDAPQSTERLRARRAVRIALLDLAGSPSAPGTDFSPVIDLLANSAGARSGAILLLRALAIEGVIPDRSEEARLAVKLIQLLKSEVPELLKRRGVDERLQTHEAIDRIRGLHLEICNELKPFRLHFGSAQEILSTKQQLYKALNAKWSKTYLEPFGASQLLVHLGTVLEALERLENTSDSTFCGSLDALERIVAEQRDVASAHWSFLNRHYYVPFLDRVQSALRAIAANSDARFDCDVTPIGAQVPLTIEKRLPLHRSEVFTFLVPLRNTGPGIAYQLRCTVQRASDDFLLGPSEINVGDRIPGDFTLALEILPGKPVQRTHSP
jgi:hypothetical protein